MLLIICLFYCLQTDVIVDELTKVFGPKKNKEVLLVLVPEVTENAFENNV